jgi:hypothetical protein
LTFSIEGTMASAEEYRRYAAQCLALAQTAATSEDRAHLLQMAQAWRDLAEKLSDLEPKN